MRRPIGTGNANRDGPEALARASRRRFTVGLASLAALATMPPERARATGGLDVTAGESDHTVRVLLAIDTPSPARQLDTWRFGWSGRTYRGTFATVALPDGRSGLVNALPLDAYLYGVLSEEVSPAWAPGAQQAQALVSRTYLLRKLRPERPYDVVAGDADQNYGGIESESVEGRAAVDATASTIVAFASLPAHVAYSSCCGGKTADAGDVWDTPYPYLTSIVDPNCSATPAFAWQSDVSLQLVDAALKQRLSTCGRLHAIELRVRSTGARPQAIAFVGDASTVETPVQTFRSAVGAGVVRSTFIHSAVLDSGGASIALTGTGRGHGVGLCQWGARVLGQSGAGASDIIAFYFPGTTLGRA